MTEATAISSRDRIIDISGDGARLSINNGLLVIHGRQPVPFSVPIEDVAVVVLAHPGISLTQAVLGRLAGAGAVVIACDEKHLPAGMLLPLVGHFAQSERFERQAQASTPVRKRLWQQIIKAKIAAQGGLLKKLHGTDRGLLAMAKRVKSGDPDNLEAQASRRYWSVLFGGHFKRDREGEDENALLNYGYAVLRAMVARAICAGGLHPTIGVHHHNRYDAFCPADDLMEPFRPLVDEAVFGLLQEGQEPPGLDPVTKKAIVGALTGTMEIEGESRTLFDSMTRTASSLAGVFEGKSGELVLPKFFSEERER